MIVFAVFLAVVGVIYSGAALAQPRIVATPVFPPRNYELRLGDTITPVAQVFNAGDTASQAVEVYFRIRYVATGLTPYYDSARLPSLAPHDSIIVDFSPYASNPNKLNELGTFASCVIIGTDTQDVRCSRLFGIRRTAVPFIDPSDNYSHAATADIPDQTLWVSEGATIVKGDDSTWDPPPPRNISLLYNPDSIRSPVMRLDREDEAGKVYTGANVGDTLTSFPINLQGKTKVIFHFDFMRAGKHHYPLGWDDSVMVGPESTVLDSAGNVLRPGDSLILEFKNPADSELNPPPTAWKEMAAIDGGHDFEFKSFFMLPEPGGWQISIDRDTFFRADTTSYFTADFRFRFRLKAKSDGSKTSLPMDDGDPWYIDNPTVSVPLLPDIEVRWVRVVNPYTKVPRSQAIFPVYADVLDFGSDWSVAIPFLVSIFDPNGLLVYSQVVTLDQLREGKDTTIQFPDWDATRMSLLSGAPYLVTAAIAQSGINVFSGYDTTFSKFYLNVEQGPNAIQEFALDDAGVTPQRGGGNDIPALVRQEWGGLGFPGTSGSFAMKFQLARADTLYGVRAYFDNPNADIIPIRISILSGDSNSCLPGDTVSLPGTASTILSYAGDGGSLGVFKPYYFPKPLALAPGIYWAAISQLELKDMELGGDLSRGGGELQEAGSAPYIHSIFTSSYGTQWGSDSDDNSGNIGCSFAVEIPAGSGNWQPMMPASGWWPAMVSTNGLSPTVSIASLASAPFTGAGTYIPMIRPMFMAPLPSRVTTSSSNSPEGEISIYPNPFDPSTSGATLRVSGLSAGPATVEIRNVLGVTIRTFDVPRGGGSSSEITWDGRDENGKNVPACIYFIVVKGNGATTISKVIVRE